jgi:hypothetical protein
MVQRHFSGAALCRRRRFGDGGARHRRQPLGREGIPRRPRWRKLVSCAGVEQCSGPPRWRKFSPRPRGRKGNPRHPRGWNGVPSSPRDGKLYRAASGAEMFTAPHRTSTYRLRPSVASLHRKASVPTNHHALTANSNTHRDGGVHLPRTEVYSHPRPTGGSLAAGCWRLGAPI